MDGNTHWNVRLLLGVTLILGCIMGIIFGIQTGISLPLIILSGGLGVVIASTVFMVFVILPKLMELRIKEDMESHVRKEMEQWKK